jgi:hypothetical protein
MHRQLKLVILEFDTSLSFLTDEAFKNRGLRPLNCDDDVLKFANDIKGYDVIEVYWEHLFDTPIEVYEVKGKRKAFDEEVVIDLEDEYDGDGEGDSEDDSEDKEHVANIDNVSDDYTEDDSYFEEN